MVEVTHSGTGYAAKAWRAEDVVGPPHFGGNLKEKRSSVRPLGDQLLHDERGLGNASSMQVRRSALERARARRGGKLVRKGMTVHTAQLGHSRYSIGFSVGQGPVKNGSGEVRRRRWPG